MKEIIEHVLREQIDFSIFPDGTADDIARKITLALVQERAMSLPPPAMAIPGHFLPTEYYRSLE